MGPILLAAEGLSNTNTLSVSANVRSASSYSVAGRFPSCSASLIPRDPPKQATRLINHEYSNRGSGNINSTIDQGSIAAGHVPLMELVSKGIEAYNANTPHRLTQPPPKRLLLPKTSIDEKGQDSIFRYVGTLPQESV